MSIIQLEQLRKAYNKDYVLKNINLQFDKGQVIGYIGPNGAGKSTTIKIMAGIISDFEGSVKILDMDVRKEPQEIKQRIGYIPEQAVLYEVLTPREYLWFVGNLYNLERHVIETRTMELLRVFDLADKADTRMNAFSKGMRQKVLLISGLMHNPEIIFLDEPLSGLDANAVILVKEILSQLKNDGKTIFYSSHLMDIVEKISDRIIIINNGEVIADGDFASLKMASRSGSLENIFSEMTGDGNQASSATEFLDILKH